MLKTGILNPQLARVLGETGHMDTIVVCDAGLPIPAGVERIDLAWKPNEPGYLPVLDELLKHLVVEKVYLAEELKTVSPIMHEEIRKRLSGDVVIEYVPHVMFKENTKRAKAIVRTGEFTPYSSITLVAGCAY